VRRLAGADAQFIYQETRVQHLHTFKVAVIDPSTAHERWSYDLVKERAGAAIPLIPPFRWRLVKMPFGLGHPVWVDDPVLDVDYHVRRAAVPAPGGTRELCEVVSLIASIPLERDRPLWQLWVLEGLEDGYAAYMMKMHHAIADGMASAQILLDTFQPEPGDPDDVDSLEGPAIAVEDVPPMPQLLAGGVVSMARTAAGLPSLSRRTWRAVRAGAERKRRGEEQPVAAFSGPRTRFNGSLTPHRWYANVTLPLADMKFVKDAYGVTLNDVLLTLVGAVARGYLVDRGELPAESLTATVPVSVRRPEEMRTYGNRTSSWYVSLATDVADASERLERVNRSTSAARENLAAKDTELQHDWMENWWLWSLVARALPWVGSRVVHRPAYNIIVSNVRGPSVPLYNAGARLMALQSMGPLVGDLGLNVTAWSYCDAMSVGVMACRERMPDLWEFADRLPVELDELRAAAEKRAAR
jgi:WS/DGAT/MGAT family acyltransferase